MTPRLSSFIVTLRATLVVIAALFTLLGGMSNNFGEIGDTDGLSGARAAATGGSVVTNAGENDGPSRRPPEYVVPPRASLRVASALSYPPAPGSAKLMIPMLESWRAAQDGARSDLALAPLSPPPRG